MCAQKNEQIRSGNSTSSQMLLFLLLYSGKFPWGVKTQYCHTQIKNHAVNYLTYREIEKKIVQWQSRSLVLHLHGNEGLEEETSKKFIFFQEKIVKFYRARFQSVYMNDIPIVEDLFQVEIFWYDIDIAY